ncbi:E3 ubiquitin-protein ligase RHA1B-like [Impatiens glandulifera]|uniref:E3 ubiquitin-protein ligase RHA1B-like n=1 Tax=Impatiens glandulifera TaxID=253017 RepID=UPI001FB0F962|nr:E3 ubiquitin-protein ligase RHA1B-like [Impatiens glandulifera]
MAKAVSMKFVVKLLLSIAISIFMAMLKELKFKIHETFPNISLLNLYPDQSDFSLYSNEIEYLDSGSDSDSGASYLLIMEGSSTSLIRVPVKTVVASIKSIVSVIEYRYFLLKNEIEEDNSGSCIVCCDLIEKNDQIRDMPNCCHAFHLDCMDRWLDEGQITCPLCRSSMLPSNTSPSWKVIGY